MRIKLEQSGREKDVEREMGFVCGRFMMHLWVGSCYDYSGATNKYLYCFAKDSYFGALFGAYHIKQDSLFLICAKKRNLYVSTTLNEKIILRKYFTK